MSRFALISVNARYYHSSAALRSLRENARQYKDDITILEFTLDERVSDIVEKIVDTGCDVAGFSVYIWNVEIISRVVKTLHDLFPKIILIAGGPEVSWEYQKTELFSNIDYLITGEGETSFYNLLDSITVGDFPIEKIIKGEITSLDRILYPVSSYSENDFATKLIYIETSRGCPFECHFCSSGIDNSIRKFPVERVIEYLDFLYAKGVRHFKFLDRSILYGPWKSLYAWFLERKTSGISIHFELNPDRIPESFIMCLKDLAPAKIQLELGVQTFNEEVNKRIGRKQQNVKVLENLKLLVGMEHIHIHADLIAGLPGETLESIGESFNMLHSTGVEEIQFGILKRLNGTLISAHTDEFKMVYSENPPYEILQNDTLSFKTVQALKRFARYLDLIGNSGNFLICASEIFGENPFSGLWDFSEWLWKESGQTHKFSRDSLASWIFRYLKEQRKIQNAELLIKADYSRLNHIFRESVLDKSINSKSNFFQRQKKHIKT
ncbi:MAG: DUF4080 domain-containing protein [Deltaproteobacteria bacterium]|nr:DUF4080 domain-containing protein [Deltaproteobacteria bacterium]